MDERHDDAGMPAGDLSGLVPNRLPDWLVETVQKAGRNLSDFSGLEPHFRSTEVIRSDRFDRRHFKRMRDQADDLNKLAISRFVDEPTWFDLVQDEYLGFYKARPEMRKQTEMKPTHELNWFVWDKARQTRDFEELRTYTELDEWASVMASVAFGQKLADLFDEMKELREAQQKAAEADAKVAELLRQLESSQGDADAAASLLDQLAEQAEQYADANNGLSKAMQENSARLKDAARKAMQGTNSEVSDLSDMVESFGTEPGALQRMDGKARMALARRIQSNSKLKELADKVGRFVRLAMAEQATKLIHGRDEVHSISLGDDLNRVLPSELMLLAVPQTKREFYRRYAERELLQYELRGTEKVARGAIIIMIDSSGSMGGGRETWAKAVGIALLHIAAKQGRDFYGIIFGSRTELQEFYFPKGKGSPEKVLDFAEFAFMGGTDFMTPISRAISVLERQFNDEGAQKGDLVFVTDGICAVDDAWFQDYLKKKEQLGFRMYGALIGVQAPVVEALSDDVYNIVELAEGADVRDMFGLV